LELHQVVLHGVLILLDMVGEMTGLHFAGPRKELTCLEELISAISYWIIRVSRAFTLVHFHRFLVNYDVCRSKVRTLVSWLDVQLNCWCRASSLKLFGFGGLFQFQTKQSLVLFLH
jgi:hypothetical protein